MVDKVQPQDLDAEQSVLGSMMMSKDAIALVIGKLKEDHYYREAHALIFRAILELYQKNEPVDLVTVSNTMKKSNTLEKAGGQLYLADIIDTVPTSANILSYADIVVEKYMLRKLIDTGSDIIKEAFDPTQEVGQVVESAQSSIMNIANAQVTDEFVKLDEVVKTVFDEIQSVYDNDEKILGVPSGFTDLDKMTSGFQRGDLIILAARPSMGKTTLAMNMAMNVALKKNEGVAVFSLEMPKEQLALRLLSSESKLDSKRIRTANLHEHEYKNMMTALGNLSEAPIYIDDTPGISPLEMRAKVRRLQAKADIKLILIDYLQLMRSSKKRVESRFHEVSEIVRDIKGFAKESGIPIISLSQLSRAVEQRQDKTPQLSDLRESGEIEQTADLVMFINREDYYQTPNEDTPSNGLSKSDIIIAKHRNGPTGAVTLMFNKHISRFQDAEKVHVVPH